MDFFQIFNFKPPNLPVVDVVDVEFVVETFKTPEKPQTNKI